ncbi:queuosine precursor transporter [Dongshaea marina]|uniref:queuosine precursor transporter n=1 Tax=Dongshaea marina TaxID=2047966 RepID=UPI00131F36A5|nr:queuosine precursor transporter [Dongshaea marina]
MIRLRRKARYSWIAERGDLVLFRDLKTQTNIQMNPVELVNQGLTEQFSDQDRIRIGYAAAGQDSSVVVANNKGSVAVYSYSRALFIPILFTAYIASIFISCIADAGTFTAFGIITPISFIIYPLTFVFEDCVTELYGREKGLKIIFHALLLLLLSSAVLKGIFALSENLDYESSNNFLSTMSFIPFDVAYASVNAFISSAIDIIVFSLIYTQLRNYGFWFRATVSSFSAQFVASILAGLYYYFTVMTSAPFGEIYSNSLFYFLWSFGLSVAYIPLSYAIIISIKKLSVSPRYREFVWNNCRLAVVNILAILAQLFSGITLNLYDLNISVSALLLSAICALTLAYLRDNTYINTLAITSIIGLFSACLCRQQLPAPMSQELLITSLALGCIWLLAYLENPWVQLGGMLIVLLMTALDSGPTLGSFLLTLLLQGAIIWLLLDKVVCQRLLAHRSSVHYLAALLSLTLIATLTYTLASPLLQEFNVPLPSLWLGVALVGASCGYLTLTLTRYKGLRQSPLYNL